MNVLVFGATQGMGQAVARGLAQRGDTVFLLGRDPDALLRCARDLEARSGRPPAGTALCDLREPQGFAPALDAAWQALGRVDVVVVTAGLFDTQSRLVEDRARLAELLQVNFSHTVLFCEDVRKRLQADGGGTLCVFSSVAGDRGRKPVALYGAAKAGLSYYLEALDHAERDHGLVTICVKPGFVKTGMTAGLKPPPFAGEPEAVAREVIRAIDRGRPVVYTPWPWAWIMRIIRLLPRVVMRKLSF
jgi:short-subunit dehydrogenase